MAKTAKAAAPKKKSAPAKTAKATSKGKPAPKSAPKAAPKAAAKASKPAPKAAAAKGKAPAAAKPLKAAAPAVSKTVKAPAAKPAVVKAAPKAEPKAPAKASDKAPGKAVEAEAAPAKPTKNPDLKVVEPKVTPSLMSKVQKDEPSGGDEATAPKKKRSEKDPLAGLDKIADPVAKWEALSAKATLIPTAQYKMSGTFEPKTGLQHKVLGWGYVLSALNDRLEVLFKDGVRILISNYKAP